MIQKKWICDPTVCLHGIYMQNQSREPSTQKPFWSPTLDSGHQLWMRGEWAFGSINESNLTWV
ncbi:hypothetical protein M6B38_355450 [Iris pallida]|uniref:Uncharacterized protein n=1 Tax=Iris pallida TaxID=29817 RepID=A0AAX6GMI4_IRIPA|nr:hypothetical protein M6B38_355450 [Iris pallida]